jgi:hypothetical protein
MFKTTLSIVIFFTILSRAQERYNYADTWKNWNDYTRYVFLWGFQVGGSAVHVEALNNWIAQDEWLTDRPSPRVEKVRNKVALFFDLEIIRDVIKELYKDPSNSFIPFSKMIFLSRDKLRGDNIDEAILSARKEAHENFLLNEKIKNQ